MSNERVVGMDHGTSNSAVATINKDGRPEPVANAEGAYTTKSAIFWSKQEQLFGEQALNAAPLDPSCLIRRWKPEMANPTPIFTNGLGQQLTAKDAATLFLGHQKADAEQGLGDPIGGAVVTCPAYFKDPERRALREAAEKAGLKVLRLLDEPTAAGMAYLYGKTGTATFGVFDWGAGTLDVSLMRFEDGRFRVLGLSGDTHLGGGDIDDALITLFLDEFRRQHGDPPDPAAAPLFHFELREKVERAKIALSAAKVASVSCGHDGKSVVVELTRAQVEAIVDPMMATGIAKCEEALKAAGLGPSDMDFIALVGGPTRMPIVQQRLAAAFGREIKRDLSPDLVVAQGAALAAWAEQTKRTGAISVGGKTLRAPALKVQEVVAHPLSCLAINGASGREQAAVIIPAQSPIPAERTERFALDRDDQTEARIVVVQAADGTPPEQCTVIGELTLADLPVKLPREKRIEVCYRYDADAVIHVLVRDLVSGKNASTDLAWAAAKGAA